MSDAGQVLQQLLGSDLLLCVAQKYVMKRADWGFDIEVCQFLSGEGAGKFIAIPKLAWKEASPSFFGHGNSEGEALRACLAKIQHTGYEAMFPDDAAEEGGSGADGR